MDGLRYQEYLYRKYREYEDMCQRCGACCGIRDGDPCAHLQGGDDGRYFCNIYEDRLGMRRTVSGKELKCVPIRTMFSKSWRGRNQCAYVKALMP